MMTGIVRNRHALLPVTFLLPNAPDETFEFVIDTGFTGWLTLPPDRVAAMQLPFLHRIPAGLADGSSVEVDVFAATILWHGGARVVRVMATGNRALLGTMLLDKNGLLAHFQEDGPVLVDELP